MKNTTRKKVENVGWVILIIMIFVVAMTDPVWMDAIAGFFE